MAQIQVRVADDLMDDAVLIRTGAGVLLVMSQWLHLAQRLVLGSWVAAELHSDRATPTTKRWPAGSVVGHTRELAGRQLADLMDEAELSLEDLEHVIHALCTES